MKADVGAVSKPYKPNSSASFTLQGKHASAPLPKVGDKVAVHTFGKVKSVSSDHYASGDPEARYSVDLSHHEFNPYSGPAAQARKSISDLITARQNKTGAI